MAELVITYRGVVYPWQCDHMGHMNVMWYVSKFDEATWQLFGGLGITASYMRENNRGLAALEQHTAYKCELLPGDTITIRSGVLEVREKVVRFFHEMSKDENDEVAAITALTGVHMDTQARKSCPLPEAVQERARALVIDYDTGL